MKLNVSHFEKVLSFFPYFFWKKMFRYVILLHNLRETAHFKNEYYVVQAINDP